MPVRIKKILIKMAVKTWGNFIFFRRSIAASSVVSDGIWQKFKLIQAFMNVLVSYKSKDGQINKQPMGNDRSPGSKHIVWRHHNLRCSKAGNSELETVLHTQDIMPALVFCNVLKRIWIKIAEETWWNYYFSDAKWQLSL